MGKTKAASRKAAAVTGLDIGATAVRAVIAEQSVNSDGRAVHTIRKTKTVPLPTGAVVGGQVRDQASVAAAVKKLRLRGKVVVTVDTPQAVIKPFTLADSPRKPLRDLLPAAAGDSIALPVDSAILDFCPYTADSAGSVAGLLVAVPKDPVSAAVAAVTAAGVDVARVDAAPLALLRACGHATGRPEMVVDIGADLTTMLIHVDGRLAVVRTVARGGAEITTAIADAAGVGRGQADVIKKEHGLSPQGPLFDDVMDVLRPLRTELSATARSYQNQPGSVDIAKITLTGRGACMSGLPEWVGGIFDIPVTPAAGERRNLAIAAAAGASMGVAA